MSDESTTAPTTMKPMDRQSAEVCLSVAHRVARKMARRVRWADESELTAAAMLACVKGWHRYSAACGSIEGWAWGVCVRAQKRALARDRAPTSGHTHNEQTSFEVSRADAEVWALSARAPLEEAPGALLGEAAKRAAIRTAVLEALGNEPAAEFAFAVLTGEFSPRQVAQDNGVREVEVLAARDACLERLRASPALVSLWIDLDD